MVGLGRGRSGGVWGRRQPTVGEDRAHDTGVVPGGDETQATAPARAGQHVFIDVHLHTGEILAIRDTPPGSGWGTVPTPVF